VQTVARRGWLIARSRPEEADQDSDVSMSLSTSQTCGQASHGRAAGDFPASLLKKRGNIPGRRMPCSNPPDCAISWPWPRTFISGALPAGATSRGRRSADTSRNWSAFGRRAPGCCGAYRRDGSSRPADAPQSSGAGVKILTGFVCVVLNDNKTLSDLTTNRRGCANAAQFDQTSLKRLPGRPIPAKDVWHSYTH
jgi:hypothetical protein